MKLKQKTRWIALVGIVLALATIFPLHGAGDNSKESPSLQQQIGIDERLWGEWTLQNVEYQLNQLPAQKLSLETLQTFIKQTTVKDLFLFLVIFDNAIGVCSSSGLYPEHISVNEKGTFYTKGDELTVTLNRTTPETFTIKYTVTGDVLTFNYSVAAGANRNFKFAVSFKKTYYL